MKRLCIYQLYDEEGIIEEYIYYWINEIVKLGFEVFVVSNGYLNESSIRKIETICTQVFIRDDYGYDAMAFRYALVERLGRDFVKKYDECLIINDTVFGPFISLNKIFEEMNNRCCDFWGITHQCAIPTYYVREYTIPYHIQAYFVVFHRNVLQSDVFWEYWENMSTIDNYEDAILKYEFRLTYVLMEAGFVPDAFYNKGSIDDGKFVDLMERPLIQIEGGVPILKKKLVLDKNYLDLDNFANRVYFFNILKFIKQHYEFDTNLIITCIERKFKEKINLELLYKNNNEIVILKRERCWEYRILSERVYDFVAEYKSIWLYGAGYMARFFTRIIQEMGFVKIKGILVSDKNNNPSELYGVPVYLADTILIGGDNNKMSVLITIIAENIASSVEKYLRDNGVSIIERIGY